MTHKKQALYIPPGWEVNRNEFYDIDPFDNSSADDKSILIFCQEDMLWLKKGDYHIDLGWYGRENLHDSSTGFCIHLYRGEHWNKCELLEKFRSKNKDDIVDALTMMMGSVEKGDYKFLTGYKIDEDDPANENSMEDFETYSVRE